MLRLFSIFAMSAMLPAQTGLHVSPDRIRAHVKYLASDELEGRGVGTKGENLATNYIASQLEAAGLKPAGDNDTFFQQVPMIGAATEPNASLTAKGSGNNLRFSFVKDFVGTALSQQPENDFDAEAVFVGHGISAPQFGWDDYKSEDVKGKVLIYFTNEPPSEEQAFFNGRALTYFGRWTYKYEEAARRGAVAAIIIHTTPTAGYGWPVVQGSYSRERPQLKLKAGENGLKLAAWMTEEAGARLVAGTGKSIPQLLSAANEKNFRPMPLGIRISGHIPVKLRNIPSRNVIARVDGSGGASEKSQAVVYSAHWDHLGVGLPVNNDSIYNGAVDNATGCAIVLELARVWASLPEKPKRSALFAFVTAEESGLLGSEYFGEHPVIPAGQIAADLNYDGLFPFGETRDVSLTGAERTTLWPLVQRDAKRFRLTISPDAEPEQGHYYRSDHFSLARVGIPAFSISPGTDYIGKSREFGKKVFDDFNSQHYHQPSDEYRPDWDLSGMTQMTDFGLALGIDIANTPKLPTWNAGDEFLDARVKSFK